MNQREIDHVLVLADGEKSGVSELLPELDAWLGRRVSRVRIEPDLGRFCKDPDKGETPDLVVVLGGDGSILTVVRAFASTPVPTFGINFGRVGFLASTPNEDWSEGLQEALDGDVVVEWRMRLLAELHQRGDDVRALALNDVVVQRAAHQRMFDVALRVGDHWVTNYRADGLILATPSGSTAHSLAAGGPILAPSVQGIVVTPICPQGLSHRPIVLHAESEIRLSVAMTSGLTTLVVDGQGFFPMRQGESVTVRRHHEPYPLLARRSLDPYKRLRDRLGWRGTVEADPLPLP